MQEFFLAQRDRLHALHVQPLHADQTPQGAPKDTSHYAFSQNPLVSVLGCRSVAGMKVPLRKVPSLRILLKTREETRGGREALVLQQRFVA